ncbi:MAG TPA: hypothetical protein VGM26_10960 [Rhizomicrobium sp.]|jgi:hypothetical protein
MNIRNFAMIGAAFLLLLPAQSFAGSSISAEREATRQLNLQAAEDAQASNARAMPVKDAAANAPDNTAPAAAPSGNVQMAAAEAMPQTLSEIANPPSKIATANVLDSGGQIIGAVQKVEVSPSGTPTRVTVALTGTSEKMVMLEASSVRYDAAKNQIMASDTADQIRARPKSG